MLTSIAPEDLNELGLQGGPGENAMRLAALARDAGCAGVVCSAHEVRDLKRFFGDDFLTLTPGIRPAGSAHGDQKRVMTPAQAVDAGADYIVVGRPIVEAPDPLAAAKAILGGDERPRVSAPQLDLAAELARSRRAAGRTFPVELGAPQRSLRTEVPHPRGSRSCSNASRT